jgi:hypothetical protein
MHFLGDLHRASPYAAGLTERLTGLRRAAQTSLQRFEQNFSKHRSAMSRSARAVDPEPTCYVMLLAADEMRASF